MANFLRIGSALLLLLVTMQWVFGEEASDVPEQTLSDIVAKAQVHSCADAEVHVGTLTLQQRISDEGIKLVDVELELWSDSIEAGKHAVHIHETANCTPCSAAKGHFDPGPHSNTSPDGNHPFHMGDLPNIEVDENHQGSLRTTTSRITLSDGPLSIFDSDGSAVIVHVDADTYCPEGEEAGCAGGARAACGVIQRVE
ncbi:MAG: superoxide dismutase family protein [Gammaproteobacteria bacterium]|nr:superoxide dismutase family protein [Gammaproteobacteria bacterium]